LALNTAEGVALLKPPPLTLITLITTCSMKHYHIVFIGVLLITGCNNKENFVSSTNGAYGIDVSHHQGKIKWDEVRLWGKSKIEFVYIKATEGATYHDRNYYKNIEGAKKNGLLVGSYHYFRTTSTPEAQFKNFKSQVDRNAQDLIPMIDLEENNNWDTKTYNKNLQVFLKLVEEYYRRKPILYSVQGFYNTYLKHKYLKYHWNIARYNINPPSLQDKNRWSIWQFTDQGEISGIDKRVDLNVLNSKTGVNDITYLN
jgi:lysozyme